MINLLPIEEKRQIRAARSNVLLLRYTLLSLGAMVVLGLIVGGAYVLMNNAKASAEKTIAENAARASSYNEVTAKANEFRANLSIAKSILDKEVNYTNVIIAIAQSLPDNVVLDSLDLDAKTFGTPFSLSARTKSYDDAVTLKNTLQESDAFSDVSLQSVTNAADGDTTGYPVSVSLNVTISQEITK